MSALPPGSTIGIIGGGQLGRMMAIAAARLGYCCHVYDPHEAPCAAEVSARFTRAGYDDQQALAAFAGQCDVVTYEFENIAVEPLKAVGQKLLPRVRSLEIAQDRVLEKRFLETIGAPIAPWLSVDSADDAAKAEHALGLPLLFKTRRFGYDGKGQAWAKMPRQGQRAFDAIGQHSAVAEKGVDFAAEFSLLIARDRNGETRCFDPPRNIHEDGILRRSIVPAGPIVESQAVEASDIACRIVHKLDHIGVLTVEFFATASGPLVNEIAPRVHNSGHWTIEGALTSQFEQHVRAICGLPLGKAGLVAAAAQMENLIGRDVDRWADLVAEPGAAVHLYNKGEPRSGRKMGHVTRVGRRA